MLSSRATQDRRPSVRIRLKGSIKQELKKPVSTALTWTLKAMPSATLSQRNIPCDEGGSFGMTHGGVAAGEGWLGMGLREGGLGGGAPGGGEGKGGRSAEGAPPRLNPGQRYW